MWTFVACLASSLVAAEPPSLGTAAIVHAGRETYVSGTKVLDSISIFPGDNLETRSPEFASVLLPGTSLRILGQSQIRYYGTYAELLKGQASVSTTSRFILKSRCFSVRPNLAEASTYDVVPYKGRIYISAHQGDLTISGKNNKQFHLVHGKTAAISSCGLAGERIEIAGDTELVGKVLYGSVAAAGVAVPLTLKECVSSESPNSCSH